jgi:hypothetical protein
MATRKISERCMIIYLLGLTSVTYVTPINNSAGIVGERRDFGAQDEAPCVSEVVGLIVVADS